MDFQKKFSLPRHPEEFVIAQWERGYGRLHLYFRDRLVAEVNSAAKLRNGVKFTDPELNTVELLLTGKPMSLNLIVDGFHSSSNRIHPYREIRESERLLWVVVFFAFITLFLPEFGSADFWLNAVSLVVYLLPIFLLPKLQFWSYFVALGWFSLFTLFAALLTLANWFNIVLVIVLFARIIILILMIRFAKDASSALRHKRYLKMNSYDLLDDFNAK